MHRPKFGLHFLHETFCIICRAFNRKLKTKPPCVPSPHRSVTRAVGKRQVIISNSAIQLSVLGAIMKMCRLLLSETSFIKVCIWPSHSTRNSMHNSSWNCGPNRSTVYLSVSTSKTGAACMQWANSWQLFQIAPPSFAFRLTLWNKCSLFFWELHSPKSVFSHHFPF